MTVCPHDLLRLNVASLQHAPGLPEWAMGALRKTPWVVVRRAPPQAGVVPVGIRGMYRSERHAARVPYDAVEETLSPEMLITRLPRPGRLALPVFAALPLLRSVFDGYRWGPAGSAGYELATGTAAVSAVSDIDVILRVERLFPVAEARRLQHALQGIPVRVDVLLELPLGAVALEDYVRSKSEAVLRTCTGPRLVEASVPRTQQAARRPWLA